MVEAGLSFGAGLLVGGFSLMLLWGLLWLVVGAIGMARQTCPSVILLSSLSSSAIAALAIAGLFWAMDPSRPATPAFHFGTVGIPLALVGSSFGRLKDGRRIGTAFIEGTRAMLHQFLGLHHHNGCEGCHEKPCEEQS